MTSEEHDEAVMLEAAMFGGIPESDAYKFSYPSHQEVQVGSGRHTGFYPWTNRPPSPTLAAQRMLREQQVSFNIYMYIYRSSAVVFAK